jgi:ubiquinone/menaquinone biosynthesis C-methylase UbiE
METTSDALSLTGTGTEPLEVKTCCTAAYESEWATLLLGDSLHPGGLALTERLGVLVGLTPDVRVLDVAAGRGTSAIHLARTFGCAVVGVDYGGESVKAATEAAEAAGVAHLARFERGDAERLELDAAQFDAVICECAFCTFPNKHTAAQEFARVLKPGGKVGLADLTRTGDVPGDLKGLLAWVACLADAQPLAAYERFLQRAGLTVTLVEEHDDVLATLVQDIRTKLMATELLVKLKRLELPVASFEQAKALARAAANAVHARQFGYALLVATRGTDEGHIGGEDAL